MRPLPTGRPRAALAAVLAAAALPGALAAQATTAVIAGVVRAAGAPVAGATVTVRNEATGLTVRRVTGADGRYAAAQLPLGGPYTVTARRLGYQPVAQRGVALRLGDRFPADFALEAAAQALEAVTVSATAGQRESGRAARVGATTIVTQRDIGQIPALNRSFTDLALLAPGTSAAGTGGVITSSFSLNGGRVTGTDLRTDGVQTKNTLWGAGFGRGPYSLSMEAVREYEVVTNLYDVTQGRQSAGAINVVTQSGTNERTGSLFGYFVNSDLTTRNFLGVAPFDRRVQWGGSAGGPVVRDRLHYFVAFDRQDLTEPFQSLDVSTPANVANLGVHPDSVARFLSILQAQYGLPAGARQVGQFTRASVLNTAFARLDWAAGDRHRVTLRNQYSDWLNPNSLTDGATSIRESWGTAFSRENQTMASLTSSLGAAATNDLRVAYTYRDMQNRETTRIPRGWVNVASTLPGEGGATRTGPNVRLQFGGMRTTPEWQQEHGFQLVDVARFDRGRSTFTLGTDNALNRLSMYVSIETMGRYTFPSLAALEQRRPAEWYRLVPMGDPSPVSRQWVYDGGAFAQGEFRLSDRLTATAGLRYDVAAFLTRAERNPLAEERLGLRTDARPVDGQLQPRAQVVWDVTGRATDVLRVGGGLFTAQPHHMLQINNILNDGMRLAEVRVTGSAVPTPDFASYRRDLAAVPGLVEGGARTPAYLNVMSPDFNVPRTWKADAAYQRRFGTRAALGLALQYARVTNLYHYYDRNLAAPAFTLAGEGGRAVFVPADSIPRANPQGAGARTRLTWADPNFSRVLQLRGDARGDQRAAVVDGSLRLWRDGFVQGSYTYNRTRDNTSYNCCIAVSASFTPVSSDPRDLSGSWGPSNTDFRHKVAAFGSLPSWRGVRLSARYVGLSGTPFSAMVAGDVNGDDPNNNNDLAMVFDPDAPGVDPAVADAMRRVLADPDNVARGYLRANLGRVARRNGAANPFFGRLDLRLASRVPTLRGQRVELTVDVFNVANLIDRDRGAQRLVPAANQALLSVRGFEPAGPNGPRYLYNVNERFGQTVKQGDPYQIQLGARYGF
jgi:hypothetical protein